MSRSLVTTKLNSKYTAGGSGGSGTTYTVGTIDSQTKSANGLVITGSSIYAQTADNNNPGLVSTGTQTFKGSKTFNNNFTATANNQTFQSLILTTSTAGFFTYTGLKKSWITLGADLYWLDAHKNNVDINNFQYRSLILGSINTGNTSVSSGANNMIWGSESATALTSGSGNVILGNMAATQITSSSNNVIIGQQTASSVGPVSGNLNVIVGAASDLANTTDTNSIVIGAGAAGGGSNTATIGSNYITATYLKGTVNLDNNTPLNFKNSSGILPNHAVEEYILKSSKTYTATTDINGYFTLDGAAPAANASNLIKVKSTSTSEIWLLDYYYHLMVNSVSGATFTTANDFITLRFFASIDFNKSISNQFVMSGTSGYYIKAGNNSNGFLGYTNATGYFVPTLSTGYFDNTNKGYAPQFRIATQETAGTVTISGICNLRITKMFI